MKILVPIKAVIDYNAKVRIKIDGSGIEQDNMKMSINPFDEIALEESLRLKEKGIATEVIVVSIGTYKVEAVLKNALAMGADRGIFVESDEILESLSIAKILCEIVKQEKPIAVIAGKQTTDNESNQTGQMLAALLGWSQATFVSKIEMYNDHAITVREMGHGTMTIEIPLPAVITVDLNLNEPRYISLPNIMKARKKQLEKKMASDFAINLTPRLKVLKFEENRAERTSSRLYSATELIETLKSKHGLL
ncbi:electron transfer flavoprotein subunit beta [Candidatus Liberibacter solanacearum]|uniref:Electron transfer flavoprotein subunit beta n=1 Tax=Candidatus Liberibacter solanacearum TaxID=556287 RepID=A0A094Z105_9HYPH|nr:electron transfer flavoprotein subunit beta/FixA family protein [Candidatus Liberibacter solanacearum]KGB27287.1 electron transfer flavoprotein subunit beta [Candidatus Liberibacter solanacearum]KJZ80867.1 electron transfer flavoprotein subunit beta [Candidatus Liberibacter solanacearum]KJZ82007.1 Electron transfer flavoprotein, beta subunit [Candidatus Liberibacter solanacearum]KQC49564.1 electron transfer flavoprotein subunit beta [Candidatus Liberibacter solanacearum]